MRLLTLFIPPALLGPTFAKISRRTFIESINDLAAFGPSPFSLSGLLTHCQARAALTDSFTGMLAVGRTPSPSSLVSLAESGSLNHPRQVTAVLPDPALPAVYIAVALYSRQHRRVRDNFAFTLASDQNNSLASDAAALRHGTTRHSLHIYANRYKRL